MSTKGLLMNSSNKKIFSLIFITVCCIILFGHFQINSNTASTNNVTVEVTNTEETTYVDPELIKSANNNYTLSQEQLHIRHDQHLLHTHLLVSLVP